MHRQVKKNAQADLLMTAALARHQLAPSKDFENAEQTAAAATQDASRCFDTLDKTTRLSLPIMQALPPAAAPSAAPTAVKPGFVSAQTQAPVPQRFDTSKQEYQPGLKEAGVIEALLNLHQRARGPASQAPLAGFRAQALPQVKASPKPAARSRIFRPRGETES
jgi:hypothetical protein